MSKKKIIFFIVILLAILTLLYIILNFGVKVQFWYGNGNSKKEKAFVGKKMNGLTIVDIDDDKVVVEWEGRTEDCEYNEVYSFWPTWNEVFIQFPLVSVIFEK